MKNIILGRTGLKVSVAGLGAGGGARLGTRDGGSDEKGVELVRLALDLGINLFDTANTYGTEEIVGEGLRGIARDSVVISTKHHVTRRDRSPHSVDEIIAGLDNSLRALKTDFIDIFQIHGLYPENYDYTVRTVLPALRREQEKGKFRFMGATEFAQRDHGHAALTQAIDEDWLDVAMLAFSMVHQNARESLFPQCQKKDIGTLLMFVSRNLFGFPERLKAKLLELSAAGEIPQEIAEAREPLDFLIHDAGASDIVDAAYRYSRDEPGADVVLFGTGNPDHLRANVASLSKPPLPEADRTRIDELFGALVGVGIEPGMSRGGIME